jgi:hypothetical protein
MKNGRIACVIYVGFTKYQKVESVELEAQDDSERIREGVTRLGKTSAADLSPEEKRAILSESQ